MGTEETNGHPPTSLGKCTKCGEAVTPEDSWIQTSQGRRGAREKSICHLECFRLLAVPDKPAT